MVLGLRHTPRAAELVLRLRKTGGRAAPAFGRRHAAGRLLDLDARGAGPNFDAFLLPIAASLRSCVRQRSRRTAVPLAGGWIGGADGPMLRSGGQVR